MIQCTMTLFLAALLPENFQTVILALQKNSLFKGKTYETFPVTCGAHQGCVLASPSFKLYLAVAACLALGKHQLEDKGGKEAYLHMHCRFHEKQKNLKAAWSL